jgi:type I restriction enzyme S subunit
VGAALLLNRFRILTRPSCIDNNMMALIIEKNCYRIPYFYYLLNLLDVGEFANQGPVPSINGSQVGVIRVPIPPTNEQDEIVAFVEKKAELFQCIYRNITTQITTLVAYRKSLIHECVTGKRRIADADVAGIQSNTDGHR